MHVASIILAYMFGHGMLLSSPMENWMIPIAIALSFGCVHRMMISIPPTSDVEWMKTVSANMAMKMLRFVRHRSLSQNPGVAWGGGADSGTFEKLLAIVIPLIRREPTHQICTSSLRNSVFHYPSLQPDNRRDMRRSSWSHHFHKRERNFQGRKSMSC